MMRCVTVLFNSRLYDPLLWVTHLVMLASVHWPSSEHAVAMVKFLKMGLPLYCDGAVRDMVTPQGL